MVEETPHAEETPPSVVAPEEPTEKPSTTRNGAPLSKVEQAVTSRVEGIENELFSLVSNRVQEKLPKGVKFDAENDAHFRLYEEVSSMPDIQGLKESNERLRVVCSLVTKRADILHRLNSLAIEQARL